MKSIIVFFLTLLTLQTNAQKIFINGQEGNRLLVWDDFSGKVNKSSSFYALTNWGIRSNFISKKDGSTGKFTSSIEFILSMDSKKSWVKKGKDTEELLKHEQGHFNTGLLCLRELLIKTAFIKEVNQATVKNLQSIFEEVMTKYNKMDLQYDEETNHSSNKIEQEKWNKFYADELLKK